MKRIFKLVIMMLIVWTGLQAQDPQLTNPTVNPAPVVTGEVVTLCVTLHNNSTSEIPYHPLDPVVITISTDQVADVELFSTEGLEQYTWSVACNVPDCSDPQVASYTVRGVQNQVVPGRMTPFDYVGGMICFGGAAADTPFETGFGPTFGIGFNSNIAASAVNDVDRESTSNNQSNYTWSVAPADMPVGMTFFNARRDGSVSNLTWETAVEIGNDRFEIERSLDGLSFEVIGEVKGAGTTSIKQSYRFVDTKPESGLNYYRLKQVDVDGSIARSPIRQVKFDGSTTAGGLDIKYYPNPTQGDLSIRANVELQNHTINVINISGQVVLQRDYIPGMIVPMDRFNTGVYIVELLDGAGTVIDRSRIIKQ